MSEPGTTVGSWLLDVIGTQFRRGEDIFPRRRYIDIVGGAIIEDDPIRNSTRLTITGGGGGLGSDRIINGTSPIRINGGSAHDLTTDITVSVLDASTSQKGVVQLAGDLGGVATSVDVLKIHGASVPAAGALVVDSILKVSAVAALVYGALNLASVNAVTNRLSIVNVAFDNPDTVLTTNHAGNATQYRLLVDANIAAGAAIAETKLRAGAEGTFLRIVSGAPTWSAVTVGTGGVAPGLDTQIFVTTNTGVLTSGWATAVGDWDGAVTANVVRKLRGAAIGTAAPGLTPGTVLRSVTNSTIDYGAVDLSNEAAVASVLAIPHIKPHTAIAILTTNGALATEWSTTIPGGLFPALAGDVTGSPGANTVVKIRGAAIGTAAGALTPGHSMRVTAVATCDWGAVDFTNENAISGRMLLTHLTGAGATLNDILRFDGTNYVPSPITSVLPPSNFINVALLTDLGTTPITAYPDGLWCWVREVQRVFILTTSAVAPSVTLDIYASATAGRVFMGQP